MKARGKRQKGNEYERELAQDLRQAGLDKNARRMEDFYNWFAGFVDGEGCFYLGVRKRAWKNTGSFYSGVDVGLRISLRADDYRLLKTIQKTLKLGRFGFRKKPATNGKYTSNPEAFWQINSAKESMVIIKIFDQFKLRSKKLRDYKVWSKAVLKIYDIQNNGIKPNQFRPRYSDRDYRELLAYKERLSKIRKYDSER